ncbi:MAG: tetratricopeptide repeat protein [Limisphaerales bacterium]
MQSNEWNTLSGRVLLLLLATAVSSLGAALETGKTRLLRLVQLPHVDASVAVGFNPAFGFFLASDDQKPDATEIAEGIAALKKEVTGESADAARYERLGDLYSVSDDSTNAHLAYAKAVALYRKRVEQQPENGGLLAEFGEALEGVEKHTEAESVLRKAVRIAPEDWKCWTSLGGFLDSQGNKALPQAGKSRQTTRKGGVNSAVTLPDRPSGNQLADANQRYAEAKDCFDRAVALARHEPGPYIARALHLCNQSVQMSLHKTRGDAVDVMRQALSPALLPDLWQAARLSPTNYAVITAAALFEACGVGILERAKAGPSSESLLNSLPERSRQQVREAMGWLENLTRSADPRLAGGALTGLGLLKSVATPGGPCPEEFRRAIALDPSRSYVWDTVVACLAEGNRFDESIALCQQRLKYQDTAHNRFYLATIYFANEQYPEAEQQLRTAVKLEPDNVNCNLGLAAALMRQDPEAKFAEAKEWFLKAKTLLRPGGGADQTDENRQQSIEYLLTASIYGSSGIFRCFLIGGFKSF